MISPDPQRVRAIALFSLYEQVVPGLMGTLGAIRDHVDQVLDRQGVDRQAWRDMSVEDRERLLRKDRRRRR